MRRFLAFIQKEALHILRDPRTMLIVIVMPIVQIILFGFAISTEIQHIRLAVVIPRSTEAVRQLTERIDANPYFQLVARLPDHAAANNMLRSGKADAVLFFSNDPSRNQVMELAVDATNPNDAAVIAGYVRSVLQSEQGTAQLSHPVVLVRMLYNPQLLSAYNFVPGIMGLIFILICALMTSVSIVREKECGTMELLLVSPVRPLGILIAKMIPYGVLSCFNLATILLLARYVLGVPLQGDFGGVGLVSGIYILLSLALGMLMSTVARNQLTAMLMSVVLLMLPILLLSGMLFPIENMPLVLQWFSTIVPARWYIAAVRKLMIEGLPLADVWREAAVLVTMFVLLVTVALKRFNDKL